MAELSIFEAQMWTGELWRVQWYSRPAIGEPERAQGRQDFSSEAYARAWFTSDELRDKLDNPYWRVELQRRGPWETVEAGEYPEEKP